MLKAVRLFLLCQIMCVVLMQRHGRVVQHLGMWQPTGQQPAGNRPEVSPATASGTYATVIAPIFKRACTACHNADDYDGDLDLTSKNGILCVDRDEADRVLVPGKPDKSYLIQLCELPIDDEDHMPPQDEAQPDKPMQLSKAELQLLRQWILDGCSFD